jgi:UPF0042 nucleotide-binding protein
VTSVVVVTGLSGAGRSVAGDALEDLGWFVIDNLPADLVPKVGELAMSADARLDRVALVVGGSADPVTQIEALRDQLDDVRVLFLETANRALVRRYEATRRRHPLGVDRSLVEAIELEREELRSARAAADLVIDTTELNPHQLRERINAEFDARPQAESIRITLTSFGFKHGLPLDVDLVFDCRFLPNPHWVEDLRPLSGLDDPIQEYVLDRDLAQGFLGHLSAMLDELIPAYDDEGKPYLTIAFGCTGGRHRSVAVAEAVGRILGERGWQTRVSHRDINRP